MKSIGGLTKYMNMCMSQVIQQVLPLMQLKQNILVLKEDNNLLDNLKPHEDEELAIKRSDIGKDNINLVSKSLNTRNHTRDMLLERTS